MTMTRRQAKQVIRQAVRQATDEKLVEILDAARQGRMRWSDPTVCLAGRLYDRRWCQVEDSAEVNSAYLWLAGTNEKRQRMMIPIINAAISERTKLKTKTQGVPSANYHL